VARSSAVAAAAAALLAACAAARSGAPHAAPASPEAGWTRRAFAVQERGHLLLALPPGWTAEEGEPGEAGLPGIRIEGPDGAFTVLLTPLWSPDESEGPEARADTAQLFADIARRRALAGSVEREIPLEELSGPGVRAFWFAATDRELLGRAPGPDEWRNIVQGAAAVGPVLLAFTLLDNGPGPQRRQLLELVRTARHAADGAPPETTLEVDPIPADRTVPLRVAWPGKSWAVLVDLPGFTAGARRGGEWPGPFVVGVHPENGIVVSISLLPAGAAADAGGCRDDAMAAIATAIPELADVVSPAVAPGGARAEYTVSAASQGSVVQRNAHLFLYRDGLCANVHLSKADPEPGDLERMEAILASVRFGEDL
jgi:hypothetical protein